ncbi:MAG: carbamate kinase, partial [Acidimicrobiia bacterium]
STSVDRVALDFGQPEQRFLDAFTLDEARGYLAEGRHFAAGSMAPKIQAAVEFLEAEGDVAPGPRGRWVVITDPHHLADGLRGTAGTTIKR